MRRRPHRPCHTDRCRTAELSGCRRAGRLILGGGCVLFAALVALAGGCGDGAGAAKTASPSSPPPPLATSPSSPAASPLQTPSGPLPGFLLIADRGNNRLLVVDGEKRVRWVYPRPGHPPAYPFRYDDDAFFTPDHRQVITSMEVQHTIEVVDFPEGTLAWHYGHPNRPGTAPGYLDRPDDAYMQPDGTVQVADILSDRILFISPAGRLVRTLGTTGVARHDPPRAFDVPNGDTPLPGGGVLVTEIGGSWVDAISGTGRLLWSVHTPAAYPSDAQLLPDGTILLADYVAPGRLLIIDRRGRTVWSYGPASGPGMLDHPSLTIRLPDGLIAATDDFNDRVVLIDPATKRIVWQYGHTRVPGRAQGFLNTPDGMDLLTYADAAADPALKQFLGLP